MAILQSINDTFEFFLGWCQKHQKLILPIFLLIAVPKIVFWSYVFAFGNQIFRLVDFHFFANFVFRLYGTVALASALSAAVLAITFLSLAYFPKRFLKHLRVRRVYRYLSKSLAPRFAVFAVIFSLGYLGFGFFRSLVFPVVLSLGAAEFGSRFAKWRMERMYEERNLEFKVSELDRKTSDAEESPDPDVIQKLRQEVTDIETDLREEKRRLLKKLSAELRSRERTLFFLIPSMIGLASLMLIGIGVDRANFVGSMDRVVVEYLTASKSMNGDFVIVGSTSNHLVLFEPKTNLTHAIPFSQARIVDHSSIVE